MKNLETFEQFNESKKEGKSFIEKVKEFGREIKDIIKDCNIQNREFYKEEFDKIQSMKDLLKVKIDKVTYGKISKLYKENKVRIDAAYHKVFGKGKVNEEVSILYTILLIIIFLLLDEKTENLKK